jgi:hypothetical protein
VLELLEVTDRKRAMLTNLTASRRISTKVFERSHLAQIFDSDVARDSHQQHVGDPGDWDEVLDGIAFLNEGGQAER